MADYLDSLLAEDESFGQDDSASKDQDSPQDTPDEDADPLEGKPELQKALYNLYLKCCAEDRHARMMEIRDVQQACMYWRGLQYWWWSQRDESWNLPNQQHGMQIAPSDVDDMPRFEFVTNIYQAFGLSLIAAIAQAPPRTRWFPDDAEVPEDIETAEGYKKLSKIIERQNPIQVQLQDEAYHLFTGGVVGGWIRYIADGEKYGFESVEDLSSQQESSPDEVRCANCGFTSSADDVFVDVPGPCPKCGANLTEDNVAPGAATSVPSSSGEERIPKGREVVAIVGALNLKRTQNAREQSEYLYLSFEEEIHYAKLRAAHPDIADKIKPGLGNGEDNGFERNARLCVLQGSSWNAGPGESQSVLVTYSRVWFRPTAFWSDAITKEERAQLLDIFPRGCRVNFCGPEYAESEEQSMDDCWTVTHAIPGDGQHRPAIGSSMISLQDRYNTWSNIEAETYEYEIPTTYLAADTFSDEAAQEQRAEPGSQTFVQLSAGQDIRTRIMQTQGTPPNATMIESMANLMGPVAQFLTGAFPALLGAGAAQGAAGDTAAGYKMQMDQALGRIGISYVRLKQFHADIQTLSCKDYCAHASGKASMSVLGPTGDFETESVDVDALEGDARAYPEGDDNFPELWNQQRAIFMQIMQNPMGQQLMQEPDNAELATRLIGIPGIVLPLADARKKAMRVIGELTNIPKPGEGALPEESSVSVSPTIDPRQWVDADVDDCAAIAETCKRWLNSDEGFKCMKENQPGYQNVKAYMLAEKALIPPPPPPEKPMSPTVTTAFKDMPPDAQAQYLKKEFGIDVTEQSFIESAMLAQAKNSKPNLPTQGQGGPPPNPGIPG